MSSKMLNIEIIKRIYFLKAALSLPMQKLFLKYVQGYPADTDVFKTSLGHLKKVTTFYDQTRRRNDVWKKMLDLRRLKTSDLRRL